MKINLELAEPCQTCKEFAEIIFAAETCDTAQLNLRLLKQHVIKFHCLEMEFDLSVYKEQGDFGT